MDGTDPLNPRKSRTGAPVRAAARLDNRRPWRYGSRNGQQAGVPSTGPERPLLGIGDEIWVSEADYLDPHGDLRLRLTIEPDDWKLRSLEWIQLTGIEVRADGSDGAERGVWVRVSAVRLRTVTSKAPPPRNVP